MRDDASDGLNINKLLIEFVRVNRKHWQNLQASVFVPKDVKDVFVS